MLLSWNLVTAGDSIIVKKKKIIVLPHLLKLLTLRAKVFDLLAAGYNLTRLSTYAAVNNKPPLGRARLQTHNLIVKSQWKCLILLCRGTLTLAHNGKEVNTLSRKTVLKL